MAEAQTSNNKSMFLSLARVIQRLCQKVELIPRKIPEVIASITYLIGHVIIGFFHEPWYDEAVAWQIARCASIKDILFEIPHYEGHPPLWHIILLPFAKLGAPYELSLCIVSLIFAGVACCLIIWKSPFPRIIRLLLPFTYFFFYQYGVISRPYCVMMLAFVLLAMAHPKKDTKPGIYVALLMLLCLTSAYGILIAGGLTIAWILEMWNSQNIIVFVKKMLHDKRTIWLFILLIFALSLIAIIMPREVTAATSSMSAHDIEGLLRCTLYMLFALPAEVSMTTIYSDYQLLRITYISWGPLIVTCLVGLLIWFLFIRYGKRKKTLMTLIIPYIMFAIFSAFIYIYNHHIGIGLYIFFFWFWITLKKENKNDIIEEKAGQKKEIISELLILFGSLAMVISLSWNIASCIQEILYSYSIGKNEAEFIKENNLDDYQIMAGFGVAYNADGEVGEIDVNQYMFTDNIAPYFDHNIFFNFNDGKDNVNYSTHKKATEEEVEESIKKWQTQLPDVLYMYPSIDLIYEDIDPYEYKLIYSHRSYKTWKGFMPYSDSRIYAHEDLVDELGLEVLGAETFVRMQLYQ